MRKIVYIVLASLFSIGIAAQERTLNLYYIDHERSTPVRKLIDVLDDLFTTGASDPTGQTKSFLYLANGENPIIVECREENRADFVRLVKELTDQRYHTVFPADDLTHILDLYSKNDYVDENGRRMYDMVNAVFYTGENFWLNGYTESLIGRLAFIMDWSSLDTEFFHLDIYRDSESEYDFDGQIPTMFGSMKLFEPVSYVFTY